MSVAELPDVPSLSPERAECSCAGAGCLHCADTHPMRESQVPARAPGCERQPACTWPVFEPSWVRNPPLREPESFRLGVLRSPIFARDPPPPKHTSTSDEQSVESQQILLPQEHPELQHNSSTARPCVKRLPDVLTVSESASLWCMHMLNYSVFVAAVAAGLHLAMLLER